MENNIAELWRTFPAYISEFVGHQASHEVWERHLAHCPVRAGRRVRDAPVFEASNQHQLRAKRATAHPPPFARGATGHLARADGGHHGVMGMPALCGGLWRYAARDWAV